MKRTRIHVVFMKLLIMSHCFFSSSRSVLGREKEKSVCEFIKDNDKKKPLQECLLSK